MTMRILIITILLVSIFPVTTGEGVSTLTYVLPYEFSEHSIFADSTYASAQWMSAVYAALVKRSSVTHEFVPDLAAKMPTTSNGLKWRFELREARFSSGNMVTADDVVFSFKVAVTPRISPQYREMTLFLDNSSATKVDDTIVEITLLNGTAFPMSKLNVPIIEMAVFEQRYSQCVAGDPASCDWNDPEGGDAVSAGPYMVSTMSKEEIVLRRNPYYYRTVEIDFIRFLRTSSMTNTTIEETRADIVDSQFLLERGYFNQIDGFVEEEVVSLAHFEISLNHQSPFYGTGEGTPRGMANLTEAPLAALNVRRALSAVADREGYVRAIGDRGVPAAGTIPPTALYYDPAIKPDAYDIGKAMELMEDAGYNYSSIVDSDNDGIYETFFFNVTILSPNSCCTQNLPAQIWFEELKKIGIGGEIIVTGWDVIAPRTFGYTEDSNRTSYPVPLYDSGGFDLLSVGYGWSIEWDPSGLYESYSLVPNGGNFYNYMNLTTQSVVENYVEELDTSRKAEYASVLQKAIHDDLPVIPLYHPTEIFGFSEKLRGLDPTLLMVADLPWEEVSFQSGGASSASETVPLPLVTIVIPLLTLSMKKFKRSDR